MSPKQFKNLVDFLHAAEKLKTIKRHSWLSNGQQEDVAQHSWRMSLMAIAMQPYLEYKVNLLKVLKMIVIHDLVEINYQDNPAHLQQPADKAEKEWQAIKSITAKLPKRLSSELRRAWMEYDEAKSNESLFARTLDKTEVLLQHNEADIKFMDPKEVPLYFYYGREFSEHDRFLRNFRDYIEKDSLKHLAKHKINKKLYEKYL